jgi:hypothetical protein
MLFISLPLFEQWLSRLSNLSAPKYLHRPELLSRNTFVGKLGIRFAL